MEDLIDALTEGVRYKLVHKRLMKKIIEILKQREKIEKSELMKLLSEYGFKLSYNSHIFYNVIRKLKLIGIITLRRDKSNKKFYVFTPELFYEKFKIIYNQYLKTSRG